MKKVITSVISLVTMASLLAGAPKKDIVDTAVEAGSFKTLVTAVKAAGLVETLKGDGPFTVFAPTDEALQKVLARDSERIFSNQKTKINYKCCSVIM